MVATYLFYFIATTWLLDEDKIPESEEYSNFLTFYPYPFNFAVVSF